MRAIVDEHAAVERELARLNRHNRCLLVLILVLVVPVLLAATVTVRNADLVAEQDLRVLGNATLGDAAGDTVTASGAVQIGGVLDLTNHRIVNVSAPTASTDAVNKAYVDAAGGGSWSIAKAWTLTRVINSTVATTGLVSGVPPYFLAPDKEVLLVPVVHNSSGVEGTLTASDDVGIVEITDTYNRRRYARFFHDPAIALVNQGWMWVVRGKEFKIVPDASQGHPIDGSSMRLTQTGEVQLYDQQSTMDYGMYVFER